MRQSQDHFLDEEIFELLKSMPLKNISPMACQKFILVKPKINGINQFHNHINGKAKTTEKAKINRMNPKIIPKTIKNFSIIIKSPIN